MGTVHYSEGEFPLNLYGRPTFLNGIDLGRVNGSHWSGCGPFNSLNRCCCGNNTVKLYVTDVSVSATYRITVTITYSDGSSDSFTLEQGQTYSIDYLDSGTVKNVVGVITAIGKVSTLASESDCTCSCCTSATDDYVIQVDASTAYASSVVTIRTSNIRGISYYTQYQDEDTTIASSVTRGATVVGTINNIRIANATVDKDGNILKGTIVSGTLSKNNCIVDGGSSTGTNPSGHVITVVNGKTTGGDITNGTIVSAYMTSPVVRGDGLADATIINATVTAPMAKIVAVDCDVSGGTTINGNLIDPTIVNSLVSGGTRYGDDMVTVGGTVINGVCYGGQITGGTLYGGIATGIIDCQSYMIENGETTGGCSVKSIVYDGVVEGGKQMGDTIVGAIVYGGRAKCGITTGGTTTLGSTGNIKPGESKLPESVTSPVNVNAKFFESQIDDFIIWWKSASGGNCCGTNLGSITDTINTKHNSNCRYCKK